MRFSSVSFAVVRRLAAAGVLAAFVAGSGGAARASGPESVADLAAGLIDAVVNISTSQTLKNPGSGPGPKLPDQFQQFYDDLQKDRGAPTPRRVQSLGSGFVVDPSGIIVTNNHVIEDADEITANFSDGTQLIAELIGRDAKTDLAVLKVKTDRPLKALRFGDSQTLRVGDWVMAIGNPFGLGGTVTVGILSARNRDINSGPYDDFLQTDAAINRGNSGGPLFNMDGEVVGINTAIISPTGGSIGIGFAVPSEVAVHVVDQLREFGETRRGLLGVNIQDVTDELAEALGLDKARGALVSEVTPDSPAAAAGIQPGDVVTEYAGRPIATRRDLPRMVADTPIGDSVQIKVFRKGAEVTVQATIARLNEGDDDAAAGDKENPDDAVNPGLGEILGMSLSGLTPAQREQYGLGDDSSGVLVTGVEDNSPSAEKGVEVGDVILEVAQEAVSSPADVKDKIDKLKAGQRRIALMLLVNKDGEHRHVGIRLPQ
jgi:serine protease Do